jgi:hypothetical protein
VAFTTAPDDSEERRFVAFVHEGAIECEAVLPEHML